jgi:membrane protease YdiL (CAAX protease family)
MAFHRLLKLTELLWITIWQIASELFQTPLLAAYVCVGIASAFPYGWGGLMKRLANYLLLAAYVLVIRLWTQTNRPLESRTIDRIPSEPASPGHDLFVIASAICISFAYVVFFWGWGTRPTIPQEAMSWVRTKFVAAGWNPSLAGLAGNGLTNTGFQLLPLMAIIVSLGYRPRDFGLIPRRMGLGIFLVLIGIALAGLVKWAFGQSTPLWTSPRAFPLTLASYALTIFINGLPEEFIFRGVLLSRFLRRLKKPGNAIVLTSVLFVAFHVPRILHESQPSGPWQFLLAVSLLFSQPTGLVFGYLYYRTRSIWPGVLWHASIGMLGTLFVYG